MKARGEILFLAIILSAYPLSILSAQTGIDLEPIPDSYVRSLFDNGSVARTVTDTDDIALAPAVAGIDEAIRELRRIRANIISEHLILIKKSVSDEDVREVYNALLGVGNLTGLEYYNPKKDVWHTLFRASYRIESEDDRTQLEDLSVLEIPSNLEISVYQDLPPFGGVVQEYRYERTSANGYVGFFFNSINKEELRYRRIRVVKPGGMRTYVWLIRGDDYLLMYGIGAAKVFTGFGLFRDRIKNSFASRTDGLFDWLAANYLVEL